ncbi:MAG: nucleotide-binding domain-containing protein [Rhodanobacter sp.]
MNLLAKTAKADNWLERVASALDLPSAKYEAAERSYRSLAEWLDRPESQFAKDDVSVYLQGSFRMGTAIAPIRGDEYDLDVVCEVQWSKDRRTQEQLHDALGVEVTAYAERFGMQAPDEWDRCWTLNYAEAAKFHMDVLPCVPDAARQRLLREAASMNLAHVERAVSITDRTHCQYRFISQDWPASNPNGYADWFYGQMQTVFDARREYMRLVEAKVDVADIPTFRVRTPLQLAIQLLKRHRDLQFSEQQTSARPTSIIITTLSALAYQQEATVAEALIRILNDMDSFIRQDLRGYWIANPADPRENFADAWNEDPAKAEAFQSWLAVARQDFGRALASDSSTDFSEALAPRMGRTLVEAALQPVSTTTRSTILGGLARLGLRDAPHRRPIQWPVVANGQVALNSVQVLRNGFRPQPLTSDSSPVPRGCTLVFRASTNVAEPFDVYWQVVNTGDAAKAANDLRGQFERPRAEHGYLVRRESASYSGTHSIECFIVKAGYCVARSGIFVVNVV